MAPFFGCSIINNAVSFSFANSSFYRQGIDSICETVAQETAHAFGMDHQYLCSDPMTYLPSCGYKWFNDVDSPCGEFSPESCTCGPTQNSYQILSSHFGVGESPGPDMSFVRPLPNTNVNSGFIIEVDANDYYYGVGTVEAFVNGASVGVASTPPYIFNSPAGIEGVTLVEVRATDIRGVEGISQIEINVGDDCTPGSCESGLVCYQGYCIEDATTSGSGFGASCSGNETCNSSLCALDSEGAGICTEICEIGEGQCPSGFGCLEAGGSNVCWAGVDEDPSGCGCNSSNNGKNGVLPPLSSNARIYDSTPCEKLTPPRLIFLILSLRQPLHAAVFTL
ncbi:MAG: hypothetical protein JKY56_14560 [Kofleriaceae bacterium]|nr:hypothetical protein [Kofleriaceae bacterium]